MRFTGIHVRVVSETTETKFLGIESQYLPANWFLILEDEHVVSAPFSIVGELWTPAVMNTFFQVQVFSSFTSLGGEYATAGRRRRLRCSAVALEPNLRCCFWSCSASLRHRARSPVLDSFPRRNQSGILLVKQWPSSFLFLFKSAEYFPRN